MSRWCRSGVGVLRSDRATSIRAAEGLRLLHPRLAVPIHWGTYAPLGFGRLQTALLADPVAEFLRHAAELAPEVEVCVLDLGETLHLDAIARGDRG
jgi:L-ascorbate metabolism protein UlaG (beta-lactamase superfamily)